MSSVQDSLPKGVASADARAAGHFVYSRTAVGLLQLALLPILTRAYTTLDFAYVQALVVLYSGAIGIGSLGLPDAIFYFVGRHPDRGALIVRQTSALLLLATAPVLVAVSIAGAVMSGDGLDMLPSLPWLAVMLALELPTHAAVNQLLATGRARLASTLYVVFELARIAAFLVPAATGLPATAIPMALAATGVLRMGVHVAITRGVFPLRDGERWWFPGELRAILAFALPAGLAATVGRLNPTIDKYVVAVMLGPEQLGVYAAAAIEIPLITAIPFAIGAVMQVRYVRLYSTDNRQALRELWYQSAEKISIIVLPLTTLLLVIADDLISIIATPKYAAAAAPFRIFTFAMYHRVAAYGPMLQAIGRVRLLVTTSTLIILTNLCLTVPLTRYIGYNGAAIATTLAYAPAWLVSLRAIGEAWGGGIRNALPWAFYLRVLMVSWGTGAVVYLVTPHLAETEVARLAVAALSYAAVYLLVGRVTGLLRPADLTFLRRWLTFGLSK
jgi:O-antigen/teichoic acid export membrane protein